jgi:tRNA(Arg) A34 adenosine deaminase TadA
MLSMTRHDRRLYDLLTIAQDVSQFRKTKHAAAIYLGNKLISVGVNQLKTHPLQARFGINRDAIYLHAEIDAIRNALKRISLDDLSRTTLYVARIRDGKPKLSKPCAGCTRAILHFNIHDVYWTT